MGYPAPAQPEPPRHVDVEASLAAATASSALQMEEMSKAMGAAYVKVEALTQQARTLNEEANTLSEENDRLAAALEERDNTIVVLREQVAELGAVVAQQERERQTDDFQCHMLDVDHAMQIRTQKRLRRGIPLDYARRRASAGGSAAAATAAVSPVSALPPRDGHAQQAAVTTTTAAAPPRAFAQPSRCNTAPPESLEEKRCALLSLQDDGVDGLEPALAAVEAQIEAAAAAVVATTTTTSSSSSVAAVSPTSVRTRSPSTGAAAVFGTPSFQTRGGSAATPDARPLRPPATRAFGDGVAGSLPRRSLSAARASRAFQRRGLTDVDAAPQLRRCFQQWRRFLRLKLLHSMAEQLCDVNRSRLASMRWYLLHSFYKQRTTSPCLQERGT